MDVFGSMMNSVDTRFQVLDPQIAEVMSVRMYEEKTVEEISDELME